MKEVSDSEQTVSGSPWVLAIRPKTLPAAVCPVIVGTAMAVADKTFKCFPALAALAGALLLQIGVNLANDYFDYMKGVDQSVVDISDISIEIPQYGTKHSFNISVSVGIVLWDLTNKLKKKRP